MVEKLEDILKNGYLVWRNNLNIAIPFLLNMIINLLLFVLLVVIIMFLLSIPLTLNFSEISLKASKISKVMTFSVILSVLSIVLIFILISAIISAFFTAGAIGMAQRAIETGKTTLSEMIYYGKKKFVSLFFAELVISLGIILLTVILIGIPVLVAITVPFIGRNTFDFGVNLLGLLITVITILFAALPFAIVISDLGAIEGLRSSYRFVMDNKLPLLLFWAFIYYATRFINYGVYFIAAIVFSIGILFVPIPSGISSTSFLTLEPLLMSLLIALLIVFLITITITILVSCIVSAFIVSPLTTIWWSRFYLNRIKP